jgi:hypothetical protein
VSRRRPPRRAGAGPTAAGGHDDVESWPDGDWVVRKVTGAASGKSYRCPGCDQTIPPVTPHLVAWPVEGGTLAGGGLGERRHWHPACWRARDRRRPG